MRHEQWRSRQDAIDDDDDENDECTADDGALKTSIRMGNTVFKMFTSSFGDTVDIVQQVFTLEEIPNLDTLTEDETPTRWLSRHSVLCLYLAAFAIIGSSLRIYLGRIFGYDCEFPPEQTDYLSPLSTCVTATGLTEQRGGALFTDLPANMLGSLLMGILTPVDKDMPVLPWLKADHRLQDSTALHISLRVAFCGSLTTFASWNTQMVVMMVGHEIPLGPQVVQGIVGYLIGLACAVSSFHGGRHFGKAMYSFRDKSGTDEESNDTNSETEASASDSRMVVFPKFWRKRNGQKRSFCQLLLDLVNVLVHGKYSPFILVSILLALFFVGDYKMNSSFHKKVLVSSLLAPPGTLLRWKLSLLNGKWFRDSDRLRYFPFGTFLANILGSIISLTSAALLFRLDGSSTAATLWLSGLKVGFAGNLSTVSSFAKEIVLLSEKNNIGPAYLYASASIVTCCLLGLCIYLPMVKA